MCSETQAYLTAGSAVSGLTMTITALMREVKDGIKAMFRRPSGPTMEQLGNSDRGERTGEVHSEQVTEHRSHRCERKSQVGYTHSAGQEETTQC